jgi:hypothetical protein
MHLLQLHNREKQKAKFNVHLMIKVIVNMQKALPLALVSIFLLGGGTINANHLRLRLPGIKIEADEFSVTRSGESAAIKRQLIRRQGRCWL